MSSSDRRIFIFHVTLQDLDDNESVVQEGGQFLATMAGCRGYFSLLLVVYGPTTMYPSVASDNIRYP